MSPIQLFAVRTRASIRAKTDPCVFVVSRFAILSRVVQMGAMRTRLLARTSVSQRPMRVILSTNVTMAVAFGGVWYAALRISPCVGMEVTCLTSSVRASVTSDSQAQKIHTGGLVPMAQRSVFSTHLDVIGYLVFSSDERGCHPITRVGLYEKKPYSV